MDHRLNRSAILQHHNVFIHTGNLFKISLHIRRADYLQIHTPIILPYILQYVKTYLTLTPTATSSAGITKTGFSSPTANIIPCDSSRTRPFEVSTKKGNFLYSKFVTKINFLFKK